MKDRKEQTDLIGRIVGGNKEKSNKELIEPILNDETES